jgi:hypothetical protein
MYYLEHFSSSLLSWTERCVIKPKSEKTLPYLAETRAGKLRNMHAEDESPFLLRQRTPWRVC